MFVPSPVTLQRGALRLDPLAEADIPVLAALAERNREQLVYMNGPLRPDWYRQALADQRDGRAVAFTLRLADRIVGTTRFADFLPGLPAAELGWTWLDQAEHGTGLNASVKFLLLRHAFEEWRLVRLQLKTAAGNLRSQRAIENLVRSPKAGCAITAGWRTGASTTPCSTASPTRIGRPFASACSLPAEADIRLSCASPKTMTSVKVGGLRVRRHGRSALGATGASAGR